MKVKEEFICRARWWGNTLLFINCLNSTTQTLTYRFYTQLGPSLVHFSCFSRWPAIFNKLVVCPVSTSSPNFNRWGLLWCFWGVTHLLWVQAWAPCCGNPAPSPVFILEVWFSGTPWRSMPGGPIKWEVHLGDIFFIWTYFGHSFCWMSGGESALSTFGLAWWTMMDLTYFLCGTDPHTDRSALHSIWKMTERGVSETF